MVRARRWTVVLAGLLGSGMVAAQTPQADSGSAPALELSAAQKQAIYQSVSALHKNHAAPIGFRPAVGSRVPPAITLEAMPDTLAELIPAARNLEVGMIEKQVVLVDPRTKAVVAVVVQSE
jgi:hypothetical protein